MLKMQMTKSEYMEIECKYHMVDSTTEVFIMHNHDYYEIFLNGKEVCYHLINGKKELLPPDCLVFIRPTDEHTYSAYKKPFTLDNLTFSKRIFEGLLDYLEDDFSSDALLNSEMPPQILLSPVEAKRLRKQFNDFNCVPLNDITRKRVLLKEFLLKILLNHFSASALPESEKLPLWMEELCTMMRKPENFCAGNARLFELSNRRREYVCRSFRKHLNISVSEYVTSLRLDYAANLLLNSNLSVIDICFRCGFNNLSWFYKNFEEKFVLPPLQFRKVNMQDI